MHVVLFDEEKDWKNLLPLTFTRPVSEIRIGILAIKEKWERWLGEKAEYSCADYLSEKFRNSNSKGLTLYINASFCPDENIVSRIKQLKKNETLFYGAEVLAFTSEKNSRSGNSKSEYTPEVLNIKHVWDIFKKNAQALESDFNLLTKNKKSESVGKDITVIGDIKKLFIEKGAKVNPCIINTTSGSVYISKDSEIMEGSMIRGPFYLGEHSSVKLGAKIYGPTSIGPHSKVGGEINNSVIFGYSNKAHDGFLGNSVLGEWCNLGADTNNSNLKNNYTNVKVFNYRENKMLDSGLQFCGLIMGDYSKSGINTMFNTGTVVGVGCNIFGGGFPPVHLPSFSWGGAEKILKYNFDKFIDTAKKVYERRELKLDKKDISILKYLNEHH